jgi:hypothetical protein
MKIDTSTVIKRYLAYFARLASAIPNNADRDYTRIRSMAESHTLVYFGPKNYSFVTRAIKEYRTRS